MTTPAPRLPKPGERWVGGTNNGHPPTRVVILKVTASKVRVAFDRGGHRPGGRMGEYVFLDLAHFLRTFHPA